MFRILGLLPLLLPIQAVEVPATVVRIVDGDTVETSAGTVRLLWIDTPESRGNSHGPAMPEGKAATAFLEGKLAKDAKLTLWGPGDTLEKDRYQRVLAVIWLHEQAVIGAGDNPGALADIQSNVNLSIIRAGWSPYWRKYGHAPEKTHQAYLDAQKEAETAKAGAWATADANEPHISAVRLRQRAKDLATQVRPVYNWISQNVGHIDLKRRAPMLTWAQCKAALDAIRELFGHIKRLLTGCSECPKPSMAIDLEYHLMVPWMPMSTRVADLIEKGYLPRKPQIPPDPEPPDRVRLV